MNSFYTSLHCTLKVHCKTCRSKNEEGTYFRKSIAKAFGLNEDYECPSNLPWGAKQQRLSFNDAKKLIDTMPEDMHMANTLKEELRIHLDHIRLNESKNSPCWKKRQERRIVEFYQTVLAKNSDVKDWHEKNKNILVV